jgi:hypothetical protein
MMIVLFNYLVAERYIFPEPKPFSGEYWYNPYEGMDSLQWRRTNLHMHSRAWGGLTNGSENSNHEIWKLYRDLGYESIGISNYQFIDTLYSRQPYYIPVYEHGYGIFKSHQLNIGARKVLWYDLPFGQNIHHKQYILNRLRKNTEMISINHPSFFGGYTTDDFKYLGNYDLMEALNGYRNSIHFWDTALSAGKPAFLMSDDDMHDIDDPGEVSRRLMVVNAPDNSRENILSALYHGNAYGVEIKMPGHEDYHTKARRFDTLPILKSHSLVNDTLRVRFDRKTVEIRFLGQDGKLLKKKIRTPRAEYVLQPADTYVRVVALYAAPHDPEGVVLYLNPVIRSEDGKRPLMPSAKTDITATWVFRIIGFATVLFIAANIIILRKRFRKR